MDNERALAYIVTIDEIRPLPGYDRVEHVRYGSYEVGSRRNVCYQSGRKA